MYADLSYFLLYHTNKDRFSKLATTVNPVEHRAKIYVRLRVVTKTVGGRKGCSRGTFRRVKKKNVQKIENILTDLLSKQIVQPYLVVATVENNDTFCYNIAFGERSKYYYYYYNRHRVNILC